MQRFRHQALKTVAEVRGHHQFVPAHAVGDHLLVDNKCFVARARAAIAPQKDLKAIWLIVRNPIPHVPRHEHTCHIELHTTKLQKVRSWQPLFEKTSFAGFWQNGLRNGADQCPCPASLRRLNAGRGTHEINSSRRGGEPLITDNTPHCRPNHRSRNVC